MQTVMLMLLLKMYIPKRLIRFLKGFKVFSGSFNFLRFGDIMKMDKVYGEKQSDERFNHIDIDYGKTKL